MPQPAESSTSGGPLTGTQWLICVIAAIGFAFDIYEILMWPVVATPALAELLGVAPGSPEILDWSGTILWASAISGGVFGLLGGYLTDRYGRRRVLVWSILLYAFSAFAAGFSTSAWMLLVLRCTTFMGVCVEFVAAVAWLAELFQDPRRREAVLGYTQAFSSIGGLMVAGANILAVRLAQDLPAIHGGHAAWRYTLISGVIPAIPLIVIRPFLPESPAWREKREQGLLKRPSLLELFRPALRKTTIVTTLMLACGYGAAFGTIQFTVAHTVPNLPEVRELAASPQTAAQAKRMQGQVQLRQELGGLAGRFVLAFLAVRVLSRRTLLRLFQVPGLVVIPLVFLLPWREDLTFLTAGLVVAGFFTVAQFSFWGNYLPRVYPLHLRGTGESFAANVGGRMVGTFAFFLATRLAPHLPGERHTQYALAAALVAFLVYAAGSILCCFLPEPASGDLPE